MTISVLHSARIAECMVLVSTLASSQVMINLSKDSALCWPEKLPLDRNAR